MCTAFAIVQIINSALSGSGQSLTMRAQNVEVRLVFYELSGVLAKKLASALHGFVKCSDYGSFHTALVIGGVVLEWGDWSLVIPRPATAEDDRIFKGNVHQTVVGCGNHLKCELGLLKLGSTLTQLWSN